MEKGFNYKEANSFLTTYPLTKRSEERRVGKECW